MRDRTLLAQLQALPLDAKILMTKQRIREWYNYWHGNVVISFSGGKDSTVLSHLVHEEYPDVPMVFSNTGLEYPEIQAFARKMGAEFVRPKMQFSDVISKYGYPIIGKEVAEAISFARRIVPKTEGVGTTSERKRIKMRGERNKETALVRRLGEVSEEVQENWAEKSRRNRPKNGLPPPNRRNQRKNGVEKSKPHRGNTSTKERRELKRIERARRQLMGKD